ncbi:MAG: RagB/SusD family nutrient uptake outer membrane protein [Chitinophagaceae bacterium]|nr:MAG: RagB/SusD family nutrient uptake outer membrane protein [Chitinophagaceae bacterium]
MKKIMFFVISCLVLMTSCKKDFLDTGPTNSVDDSAIFTTTTNAANVLNGVYRYLWNRYSTQNQPGHGGMMLQLDFMGEDIHQQLGSWYTNSANGTGNWVNHKNDTYVWTEFPFRLYYRVVGNANALIENIDAAAGSDADKNQLKAEAKTLRAWGFFNLVQIFAKRYQAGANNSQPGVSMPLSAKDVKLPRSSVEEVYAQINQDLDEAIALFPTATQIPIGLTSSSLNVKSHLRLQAAKAIKARVALTQQNWAVAADYAKQVIDAGGHSLMSNAQYQEGFNNIQNPEWIWGVYMQNDQGDTFGSYHAQISWDGETTYVRSRPKRINSALYAKIADSDVRKKMWEPSPNATNFPLPAATFAREPYMSRKFKTRATPTIGDVPYIRLAEMYLILAEANARIPGKEAEAAQALFTLAKNRDPQYTLSTNTGNVLIEEILTQRRVELWGEGFRFFDLKRLNLPLDRTAVPNFESASVGGVMQVAAGDDKWQFAIPIAELQANPNSSQNP